MQAELDDPGEDYNYDYDDDDEMHDLKEPPIQEIATERPKSPDEQAPKRKRDDPESKMDDFFDDPELCVKIFFSAHYRDKGLLW